MSPEEGASLVAVAAIVLYAVFGGADFGGGIWSLFATGPRKDEQRDALERAIGPVWETNHVWLIFLVVTLFVVFPVAYATIFEALYLPLFLALVGIVARGAAFAFRHYGARDSLLARHALRWFSWASLLTPFALGTVIGAVSGGDIRVVAGRVESGPLEGWLTPFALVCGFTGMLISAFVAACFMVVRTEGALREDFRRRALLASLALGAVTTVAIPVAMVDAERFAGRLDEAPVAGTMGATALLGLTTLALLRWRRDQLVPAFAGATVAGVVAAWALAQHPYLLAPDVTVTEAAAAPLTVASYLASLPAGALVLVPSLWFLYATFARGTVGEGSGVPH